ncbi:MAG TPA: hypothetical protein VK308_03680, partial [Pyrinomonadaceae bacterium]|nr:hypothetical protein [Pyrinomonadaceae bacterium]
VTKTHNSNTSSHLAVVTNSNSDKIQDSICHQPNLSKETSYKNGNIGNKHITEIATKVKTAFVDEVF